VHRQRDIHFLLRPWLPDGTGKKDAILLAKEIAADLWSIDGHAEEGG
jgi:hypothetical protein